MTAGANTPSDDHFDLFVAYNARDFGEVSVVVDILAASGIRTWVDQRNLPPGRLFQDEIERALARCRAAAFFFGRHGIGPWQDLEIRLAISEYVGRRMPIIPVLLPHIVSDPVLPPPLTEFRMVRLRPGSGLLEGVSDLIWGVTGKRSESSPRV